MSCVPEVDFNKIIYCYHDLGEKKLLKKGDKVILLGYGGGLNTGSILMEI